MNPTEPAKLDPARVIPWEKGAAAPRSPRSRICRARGVGTESRTQVSPSSVPCPPSQNGLVAAGMEPGLGRHCLVGAGAQKMLLEHKRCCWCSGGDGGRAGWVWGSVCVYV